MVSAALVHDTRRSIALCAPITKASHALATRSSQGTVRRSRLVAMPPSAKGKGKTPTKEAGTNSDEVMPGPLV